MAKNEGAGAFFKGLVPKVRCTTPEGLVGENPIKADTLFSRQLLMTGPKLVFSFWLAQTLIPAFDGMMK